MNRRLFLGSLAAASAAPAAAGRRVPPPPGFPDARLEYFTEPDEIPEFWITHPAGVGRFLRRHINRGRLATIGRTAGGRPMPAVFYGQARTGGGTTTFSGALGYGDWRVWRGKDYAKTVYMAMGGVHGGEFEGIAGLVNLLAVLETGKDLLGREWPAIQEAAGKLDRIILLPIADVDGRARIPMRMLGWQGTDNTVHEYLNTGGKKDGTLIGWPECKQHIPMDFSKVGFPGGYPNDHGVNIQHDDFFGNPQPETRALFALSGREKPDLILNMHTGTQFVEVMRPFAEPSLTPAFEDLFRSVHTRLTIEGLQPSDDLEKRADPARRGEQSVFNLDSALNLHCGALGTLVESPVHNFSTGKRNGEPFRHQPEDIVTAHLLTHQEAMLFLVRSGGRARWVS